MTFTGWVVELALLGCIIGMSIARENIDDTSQSASPRYLSLSTRFYLFKGHNLALFICGRDDQLPLDNILCDNHGYGYAAKLGGHSAQYCSEIYVSGVSSQACLPGRPTLVWGLSREEIEREVSSCPFFRRTGIQPCPIRSHSVLVRSKQAIVTYVNYADNSRSS